DAGHMVDVVDEQRQLADAFAGVAFERLGAELDRRGSGRQDQQPAAGLVGLDQYLTGRRIEVTRARREALERVERKVGEHRNALELLDLVAVKHHEKDYQKAVAAVEE